MSLEDILKNGLDINNNIQSQYVTLPGRKKSLTPRNSLLIQEWGPENMTYAFYTETA